MNKKYAIILIALALIFSGTASAVTVTVDDSGGQDYLTINDAIDSLRVEDSATIIVYPGIYNEEIVIQSINYTDNPTLNYENLEILSYSGNPEDTMLKGNGGTAIRNIQNSWPHYDYTISGFTISGYDYGIYSANFGFGFTMENNIFINNTCGAYFKEDEYLPSSKAMSTSYSFEHLIDINNNSFINNSHGLELRRSCYYLQNGKPIQNNYFSGNDIGFYNWDSNSMFNNNVLVENRQAIALLHEGGTVCNNTISNNDIGISGSINCDVGTIYNNFFNNTVNADGLGSTCPTLRLNSLILNQTNIVGGPSIGGNYWAKPDGTGFSQTHPDTDGDGFCDESYNINFWLVDNYPLVKVQMTTDPVQAIDDLREYVWSIESLDDTKKRNIDNKLDNALRQLSKGNNENAIKKLEQVIGFVEKTLLKQSIMPEESEYIISEVNCIIELIQN